MNDWQPMKPIWLEGGRADGMLEHVRMPFPPWDKDGNVRHPEPFVVFEHVPCWRWPEDDALRATRVEYVPSEPLRTRSIDGREVEVWVRKSP